MLNQIQEAVVLEHQGHLYLNQIQVAVVLNQIQEGGSGTESIKATCAQSDTGGLDGTSKATCGQIHLML